MLYFFFLLFSLCFLRNASRFFCSVAAEEEKTQKKIALIRLRSRSRGEEERIRAVVLKKNQGGGWKGGGGYICVVDSFWILESLISLF